MLQRSVPLHLLHHGIINQIALLAHLAWVAGVCRSFGLDPHSPPASAPLSIAFNPCWTDAAVSGAFPSLWLDPHNPLASAPISIALNPCWSDAGVTGVTPSFWSDLIALHLRPPS